MKIKNFLQGSLVLSIVSAAFSGCANHKFYNGMKNSDGKDIKEHDSAGEAKESVEVKDCTREVTTEKTKTGEKETTTITPCHRSDCPIKKKGCGWEN